MTVFFWILSLISFSLFLSVCFWLSKARRYTSTKSVATAYDSWTNERLLEKLWGEHVHLGYYKQSFLKCDFRKAKIDFVHELIRWSGLDQLPKGSRILDVGCGIGGSARILAQDYGFDVLGITVSSAQVRRAKELTPQGLSCRFEVMNALDLKLENGSFDGVWSVEAGPHIPDKQQYADEMLRVLRPGGVLAVADWNARDPLDGETSLLEKWVMRQLLDQWAHPEFSSINEFRNHLLNSRFCGGEVQIEDWTKFTIPSWLDSVFEGFRRPKAIFSLGLKGFVSGIREIPTILLMRWAFSSGLMEFGVFRTRG